MKRKRREQESPTRPDPSECRIPPGTIFCPLSEHLCVCLGLTHSISAPPTKRPNRLTPFDEFLFKGVQTIFFYIFFFINVLGVLVGVTPVLTPPCPGRL